VSGASAIFLSLTAPADLWTWSPSEISCKIGRLGLLATESGGRRKSAEGRAAPQGRNRRGVLVEFL